ncbi:autoinducer 2 ABC transporter substrate-binding protein [Sulfobacillus thermosulfidooxidans]|uniref:autoinducer 2 ABC transporter substrate-binding protein n=1 Tax=Sulfobacillus thermosulfidooxidans TaxID=28034 RepID=UPI00192BC373|nr:autoinducer 2 ABC transporter substrate-binding protein [Sulfobacillus thermosulfidooxidans]
MNNKAKARITIAMAAATLLIAGCGISIASSTSTAGSAKQKQYSIAFVPKLVGIPYFSAMNQGGEAAAKRFGVRWIYEGPTTASVSGQAEYVRSLIQQHVLAVGVSANSPTALDPLIQEAVKSHIMFYAADSNVSSPYNQLWVEQARSKALGYDVVDIAAKEMHYSGQLAIISAGPTATNLNTWIMYMKQRLKKYPNIQLLPIQYAGESITGAEQVASRMIAAYPHLKGFIGVATTIPPGEAQAVENAGKEGQIIVTGISDPNSVRSYLNSGVIKKVVLWNPINLGYLTVWGVLQHLEHHPFHKWNNVPGLGKVEYFPSRKMLLLGPPLIIDKANDNLNF